MLIRWPRWVAAAILGCLFGPVAVFAQYGHHATAADLANPVTLPVELARQIIGSSDAFDRDTAILVGQQTELAARLSALRQLAADLDTLDTATAQLGALTASLGDVAGQTGNQASTLADPLATLSGRARQGIEVTGALATSTSALAAQLRAASTALAALLPTLERLGPPAQAVALALEEIVRDTTILGQIRSLSPRS